MAILDPRDSIDGLGFSIDDLKPERQVVAYYRRLGLHMTNEQREAINEALSKAKNLSDKNQEALRKLVSPETPSVSTVLK